MFGLEYGSMWGGSATNTLSGGFLSMTVGQNGTHFAISSAGTDISLGTLYSNAMGIGHIVENSKIESYTQTNGQENLATSLRIQYGYGDSESKTLLDEILSGKTSLAVSSEKKDGATAQTTTDANGNKTVTLYGITADMSIEDMFKAGLVLQHEAYRDGLDNGEAGQLKETAEAVLAHSQMAAQILDDKLYAGALLSLISQDSNLKKDMEAFVALAQSGGNKAAFAEFISYVDNNYDSSADYWRIVTDENGRIIDVKDDKDYENLNVYDKDGKLIRTVKKDGTSFVQQVINAAGSSQTWEEVNNAMAKEYGLSYKEGTGWYAVNDKGMYTESSVIKTLADYVVNNNLTTSLINGINAVLSAISNFVTIVDNFFEKISSLADLSENQKSLGVIEFLELVYENWYSNAYNSDIQALISSWGVNQSHCDEYASEFMKPTNLLPNDWPDPLQTIVAPNSTSSSNSYLETYGSSFQQTPGVGYNIGIMYGGLNSHTYDTSHMVVTYQFENGAMMLTHYTGDHQIVHHNPYVSASAMQSEFGYNQFLYMNLGRK